MPESENLGGHLPLKHMYSSLPKKCQLPPSENRTILHEMLYDTLSTAFTLANKSIFKGILT